jgi:hypothetical protein
VNLRETSRKRKGKKAGDGEDEEGEDSSGAGDTTVDDEHEAQFYSQNLLAPYTSHGIGSSLLTPVRFGVPLPYDHHADQRPQPPPGHPEDTFPPTRRDSGES